MKSNSLVFAASTVGSLAALIGACSAPPPDTGGSPVPELVGRTSGAAQRCVPIEPNASLRIAQPGVTLYGSGRTIWVNRLASKCPGMDRMDILIVEPNGSEYCRGDRIRTIDPVSRIPGPACILGDFVPYTR